MKILFFSPHAGIWVHAFPEALVADALRQSGHEIAYITCGQMLQQQCVVMSASAIDSQSSKAQRREVCRRCVDLKQILRKEFAFSGYDLDERVSEDDLLRIEELLSSVTPLNAVDLEVNGVPIGRYALYELILHRKKDSLTIEETEWPDYKAAMRGALIALFAGQKIIAEERPDRVVAYNTFYPINRVLWHLSEKAGIITYFLHAGGNLSRRLQTLIVSRDCTFLFCKHLISEWPRFRDKPVEAELIAQIRDHFGVLFSGRSMFGYSAAIGKAPFDIRSRFGISEDQRVVVATMSSPDERFASEVVGICPWKGATFFSSQVEWIEAVLDFVRSRPDLFLVIRVHPREFPNKRESAKSAHAFQIERALRSLPSNACVNWPADDIALYNVANQADLFLNAWSSSGKEMALLGIPVVSYDANALLYPADLNYCAASRDEYFRMIDQALDAGWDFERSRKVFRWLAIEFTHGLIDISDGYFEKETGQRGFVEKIAHRLRTAFNEYYEQIADCRRRAADLEQRQTIDRVVTSEAWSPLDKCLRRDIPEGDHAVETVAVCSALVSLGEQMFASGAQSQKGTLAHRLAALENVRR